MDMISPRENDYAMYSFRYEVEYIEVLRLVEIRRRPGQVLFLRILRPPDTHTPRSWVAV